ncbi:hypothetical protein A3F07_00480 [candidate division WWE3 bacterium RIFCSPHIGHO2_12_FULL_38_15]|uniref:MPN domain-containing protein n=1 Tax=candidate division WWE3 bacterium RIFCSPHIGHO2_02_FULL_38_14 TaxID=1802620 RepID=A0A1F4VBT8_UNCKA|nr:MAG: hypothetical protein A2793_00570 [candidate division WWE3 bacterium RIFCSPHIGHO2_01_FULL_38_45]OGC49051.1 MAG: hypothetical protein A3F07_00480 [candidate division WWE3 bacterium RIFCSPHIGHO2_12_FULL_38_15]OGC53506.1 MAG: hypothetical protein A3B64_04115 [candidate division WWE3 bacterium RIFCSPLOWO2_01_FULL_37_24]OGC54410.1 MAG: hypothetical protein A3D91_00745 [candidate division WWE3 bacterium RIFCSPHIGHO2_02_FULL_38_14]HLB51654.1 DNA repair protein RadC [Patescibacteria group bacter
MINSLLKTVNRNDLPRERLAALGAESLSDIELLSIILGAGGKNESVFELSSKILSDLRGFKGLYRTDYNKLISFKNVGLAKAASIKAVCEISKRIFTEKELSKININKPKDVYESVKKFFFNKEKEHLYLLSLDSRNRLISIDLISIGTVNETLVHPREIFKSALEKNAVSIILVHNHPSGDPNPSEGDIKITEKIYKAGTNIGISLIDHLIVTDTNWVSLKSLNLFERR